MSLYATSKNMVAQEQTNRQDVLDSWHEQLGSSIAALQRLSGNTEDEFLHMGSQLQSFYQRSVEISTLANRLVDAISGDRLRLLIERLQEMMKDMETYLAGARTRSSSSCATLEDVQTLLSDVTQPLEGFQKMNKTLRMLSISTKIESSRLGELGSGFSNLAMDVEKLSHQVNDKSSDILAHRQVLAEMIATNLAKVQSSEAAQDAEVKETLGNTAASLDKLLELNERCSAFGTMVSSVSSDVSGNISEIVSSQQFHDITRQQIEHVVEALEKLGDRFDASTALGADEQKRLINETGDVCELQEAQLRFAASELYSAVRSIVDNLRDVAGKQASMSVETVSITGMADAGGSSFINGMKRDMALVTGVLADCAETDHNLAVTMKNVAATIEQITSFVSDIEHIGSEIDLIALNSQVKAAHTGREGAALGVLAEAIKRLSDEAVKQTEAVSATLNNIQLSTRHISQEAETVEMNTGSRIATMESELSEVMQTLNLMNNDMFALISELGEQVDRLTNDVEQETSGITVHELAKQQADDVVRQLQMIVEQAREIEPASNEFKQNLRHMEERYTMESERHIHEAIARKRGGQSLSSSQVSSKPAAADMSEFGDNVDLF